MIKLKVYGIDSDVGYLNKDSNTWSPASLEDVYINVTMEVGTEDEAFYFYLILATQEGARKYHNGQVLKDFKKRRGHNKEYGKNAMIFIDKYDRAAVCDRLNSLVSRCERDSWEESLNCLRENFFWEYEFSGRYGASFQ